MLRILLLIALMVTGRVANAQLKDKVYAAFIMNFARNIEWPKEKTSGDFVIAVVNNANLAEQLRGVAAQSKNVHNQLITIREFGSVSEAGFYHIIFVSESNDGLLRALIEKTQGAPTLFITEKKGLARKGSGINFILADDKLKFEVNTTTLEKRGLKISDDIQRFGILVK